MSERFVSMDDMIACAKRELALRKRAYPKWVANGKMGQAQAEEEIAHMKAILDHLLVAAGQREENLL